MAPHVTTLEGDRGRGPILVVDDDVDQRACVTELLSLKGYAVVVACDGQDALDQLSGGLRPLVIVLDLAMPRMDGWSFLERLRGPVHSTVPVLVTSATVAERPPAGADACMEKPLDCGAFSALVARLFAGACAGGGCWDH
jgi:two-component system response regulator MprA